MKAAAALQCQGCYNAREVTAYRDPDGVRWYLCETCREYNVRQDREARAAREAAADARAREGAGQSTLFGPAPELAVPGATQEGLEL